MEVLAQFTDDQFIGKNITKWPTHNSPWRAEELRELANAWLTAGNLSPAPKHLLRAKLAKAKR